MSGSVLYVYAATSDDHTLARLTASIEAQHEIATATFPASVLLLDKPRDDLPAVMRDAFGPRVRYRDPFVPCAETGRAFCLSRFRNASFEIAREAGAEWLFLCDADTIIARPPTLEDGRLYLAPDVYWQRSPNESIADSLKTIEREGGEAFSKGNSWFIIHKELFGRLEFDENIYGYGYEDLEFNARVEDAGHALCPSGAQVIHRYHPDTDRRIDARQYARNAAIYGASRIAAAAGSGSPWRDVDIVEAIHPEWREFLWLDRARGLAIHAGKPAIGRIGARSEDAVSISWSGSTTDVFRWEAGLLHFAERQGEAMSETVYDTTFFDAITAESIRSARRCVPDVIGLVAPASVIDVGCGLAAFLKVFEECGIADVMGLDGDYVDQSRLLIDRSKFVATDLQAAQTPARGYDLAVCLEVAEHIAHEAGPRLVRFLSELAPIVWFSAALPGQGGTGHVNEQWPDDWAAEFKAAGMLACDCLRPRWLNDAAISWWYGQNSLLFVDPARAPPEALDRVFKSTAQIGGAPRLIHPMLHHIRHTEFAAALDARR